MGLIVKSVQIPFRGLVLDGLLSQPLGARTLYVLAHGAGAGMHHAFLADMTARLAHAGIATLRFQFPYMQAGKRLPDKEPILTDALDSVFDWVAQECPALRVVAGGKSMGGRMVSRLMAERPRPWVEKLIFLGFPLHPAKKPGRSRAEHLRHVRQDMLFLQGTQDALASPDLMQTVSQELAGKAHLHWIQHADHGFDVRKKSGRTEDHVRQEIVRAIAAFVGTHGSAG